MFENFSFLTPSMCRMGDFISFLHFFPFILVELKAMSTASAYKSCNYAAVLVVVVDFQGGFKHCMNLTAKDV